MLSDGTFCRLRRPIYLDVVACKAATVGCPELFIATLISKIGLFDGEPRTPNQILYMNADDVTKIAEQVNRFRAGASA